MTMLCKTSKTFEKFLSRSLHISSVAFTDLYSTLGVHPKSTQAQIKDAYYKLSKKYHPDMNQDEEAAKKFRDVSEAYKVLSNLQSKKLYDKGVIQGFSPEPEKELTPEEKFYRSREFRHKVPAYGKTAIYNFDKWTKEHYSNTFKQEHDYKHHKVNMKKIENESRNTNKFNPVGYVVLAIPIFLSIFYDLYKFGDKNYTPKETK